MIEDKLAKLGYALPPTAVPAFEYLPVVVHAGLAYVSGQLPREGDSVRIVGKLGDRVDLARGEQAARICLLHGLSALRSAIGDLERIERIIKLTGFVASAPGFVEQPRVIDAASRLLVDVLGDRGRHARTAVGVAELPRNAPVEIELIAAVRTD